MRTTQVARAPLATSAALAVALAASVAAAPAPARSAVTCRWDELRGWPVLSERGQTVFFRHAFVCPGEAAGTVEVTFSAGRGPHRREIKREKKELKPYGRWERRTALDERLAPSQYCEEAKPTKKILGRAPNGVDDRWMFELPVEAKVTATGDLAALAGTFETTARCGACDNYASYRNRMMIMTGRAGASRVEPGVKMTAEVDPPWFACVAPGSTLEVRYFAGADRDAVMRALRPDVVQTGLERRFTHTKKKPTLSVDVPVAALCATGQAFVAWEAAGRGELKRIAGGGRSILGLNCKKR